MLQYEIPIIVTVQAQNKDVATMDASHFMMMSFKDYGPNYGVIDYEFPDNSLGHRSNDE